jgi:hypothetical protein
MRSRFFYQKFSGKYRSASPVDGHGGAMEFHRAEQQPDPLAG